MGIEYLNIFYHIPNELSNRKYRYCFLSRSQRRDDDEGYADDMDFQYKNDLEENAIPSVPRWRT